MSLLSRCPIATASCFIRVMSQYLKQQIRSKGGGRRGEGWGQEQSISLSLWDDWREISLDSAVTSSEVGLCKHASR